MQLYRLIKADLKGRPWPADSHESAPAQKAWPSDVGIVVFYQRWWRNVHETARATNLPFYKLWRCVEALAVQPVHVESAVWQLVAKKITRQRKAANFAERLLVWSLADTINSYATRAEGGCLSPPHWVRGRLECPPGVFQVAVADLATAAPFPRGCSPSIGSVAKLRTPRLRKKLVRVVAVQTAWDTRAIAASLLHDARFAKPAYYINAMFAMVVRFGNTSSACERWAHELKLLWDPEETQPSTALIHRLHGRVTGLRGDGTDEAFLEALERELTPKPATFRNKQRARKGQALATWRAQRRREWEGAPNRRFFMRALSAPATSRRSSLGEAPTKLLEDADEDFEGDEDPDDEGTEVDTVRR